MGLEIVKYTLATYLDGIGFEQKIPPTPNLDSLFASYGDCDNDVILRVTRREEIPLYRWCKETARWELVQ